MSAGDGGFNSAQRSEIDRAIRSAETTCRYEFSVYVGSVEGDDEQARAYAHKLHAALVTPARSILILVDPTRHRLEIVTGADVHRELSDDAVRLAAARMRSAFESDDLVGGIKHGVAQLAESARRPRSLH